MEELNQNESAVIEEVAENTEAMKCDSCGNHGGKQKNNNSSLLKAGIALMFATSVLSLGVSCYQIFKKDDNKVEQAQNMIGSVNDKKDTYSVSDDGYLVVNGTKTEVKVSSTDGQNGVSVVDARVIELDKWGIETQMLFTMSDGTYLSTPKQKQILSEHFYEASSVQDIVRLVEEFKVPNIRLANEITLGSSVEFSGRVCVDLNGKALNYTAADAMVVANSSSLTFKNGSLNFNTEVAVCVEGTNAGVEFNNVKVKATAVVVETLEANASIKITDSTIKTVEPEVANFAFGSVGSLFVVKGENAAIEVKGTKVDTDRAIVAAKEDAVAVSLKVETTELNTTATVLDINTDEVVPTLEADEETMQNAMMNGVELNTSTITSGNFNFDPTYVGISGDVQTFDVDGKYVLATDFANLVEIVEAGSTINLTGDVQLQSSLRIDKELTIDLNGYGIYRVAGNNTQTILVLAGGDLTIVDSGREVEVPGEFGPEYHYVEGFVSGAGNGASSIAVWAYGGKVTINGGVFTNIAEDGKTAYEVVYASNGGQVVINDGYFYGETPEWTLNIFDADRETSSIIVKGGFFVGFNPADNAVEGKGTSFLAEGYMVGGMQTGDVAVYAVIDADVELIAEAIESGELNYLAVNADITLDDTITISNDLTINLLGNTITTSGEYAAFDIVGGNVVIDNGTINAYYDAIGVYGSGERVVLTLGSNLTVTSQTANCVYIKGAGANLVTSANLTSYSVQYAAIQGNGNLSSRIESITITGGLVYSVYNHAIYAPQTGTINITGGEIKGTTALYVKSGNVNISGGKFIATGVYGEYVYNGNGGCNTGDALVIDSCGYPGGNPVVTITGGTFTSANASGIAYYSYKGNTAVISAEGYDVVSYNVVTTEAELVAAVADNTVETVYVGNDINLTQTIDVARDVTINLGGNKITVAGEFAAFDIVGGNVTIDNGTINAYYDAIGVYGSGERVVLTLGSNLTVTSQTANCVYIKGAGANLVTSANLTSYSVQYAAIQGNGNLSSRIESITITGGLVYSVYNHAIYAPQTGTINITGGEIKGTTALYVKSGNVNISGGKFIATGVYGEYVYNGNGGCNTGDALVIDSCGYPGGYPVVTITGGTFEVADSKSHGIAYYIYDGNNAVVNAPNYAIFWLPVAAQ